MPRALIVEDDDLLSRIERAILVRDGFEVECATSVETAMRGLAAGPEVVVVDLHLATESGLDLASRMRAGGYSGGIVAVSGVGDAGGDALRAGADEFLAKPFTPAALVEAVRRAIADRAARAPRGQ